MGIFQFRPYKKWHKDQLLMEIDRTCRSLNQLGVKDQSQIEYLNQLFYEVKIRNISLEPKDICNKILYYIDDN